MRRLLGAVVFAVALAAPGHAFGDPGDLDRTFSSDGTTTTEFRFREQGRGVVIQRDGKIVVAGFSDADADFFKTGDFALARYNPDGSLDATFGTGGKVLTAVTAGDDRGQAVALQPDGKIVVAGYSGGGTLAPGGMTIVRYTSNGSVDGTFGTLGVATAGWGDARAVLVQPDGKIVAAGFDYETSDQCGAITARENSALWRVNANGTPDSGFGVAGRVEVSRASCDDNIWDIALQADGKIVAGGHGANATLARFLSTGSLDPAFGTGGNLDAGVSEVLDVEVQPDGRILAAGWTVWFEDDMRVTRWNSNSTPDTSFGVNGTFNLDAWGDQVPWAMVLQPDGKILIGGDSDTFGSNDFLVARVTATGQLDRDFGDGPSPTGSFGGYTTAPVGVGSDRLYGLAIAPDGKIVAAGYSVLTDGATHFGVARFLPDARPARLAGRISCNATSIDSGPPIVYGGDPASAQYVVRRSDFYRYVSASNSWELSHSAPLLVSAATKTTPATTWYDLNTGQPVSSQTHTTVPPGGVWIVAHLVLWYTLQGQLVTYAYDIAPWVSGANAFAPFCYWP